MWILTNESKTQNKTAEIFTSSIQDRIAHGSSDGVLTFKDLYSSKDITKAEYDSMLGWSAGYTKVAAWSEYAGPVVGARATYIAGQKGLLNQNNKSSLEERYNEAKAKVNETVKVDSRKFSGYIFNEEYANNGKIEVFQSLGYNKADSELLTKIYQTQAYSKYMSGDYSLGKLDGYGQRINISIELNGLNGNTSSLKSGWMINPDGSIKLNTPFSGFTK